MIRVCLVTGVPGVGKTTTCQRLQELNPRVKHVSFGALIGAELSDQTNPLQERVVRENVMGLVTKDVIEAATARLFDQIKNTDPVGTDWIVIDSHAVSQQGPDFVGRPDGASYFRTVRYHAIIHLFSSPSVVLLRSELQSSGRQSFSGQDVEMIGRLMESVSLIYSSASECPVYFVSAHSSLDEVVSSVQRHLERT